MSTFTFFCSILILLFTTFLSGCATTEPQYPVSLPQKMPGMYHKVKAGETLWRVAKTYGVGMDEILSTNDIPNIAYIEKGQLIFIPGATEMRDIILEPKAAPQTAAPDDGEFAWPVEGRVTRYFGARTGVLKSKGIGIRPRRNAAVKAARPGKVIFSDYLAGYAYTVILDHADGYMSVYSNNSSLSVKVGETVAKGTELATAGNKGRDPYLYFEIRKNGRASNPLYYLPKL